MKILLIAKSLSGGGSEMVLVNTARMLVSFGHHVDLISLNAKKELEIEEEINLHLNVAIKFGMNIKVLKEHFLNRYVTKLDRIHNYDGIFSNFFSRRNFLSKKLLNKTYFYLHFDFYEVYKNKEKVCETAAQNLKQKLSGYYSQRNVISVSNGAAKSLQDFFVVTPKKIVTIHNFFNVDRIRKLASQPLPIVIKKPYIVHAARFDLPQKRQDILFEAFKKIPDDYLLVLLTQPSEQLYQLIKRYHLESRVIVTGFQQNPFCWLKNAALSVLCSDYEGFGNVLVESLICGVPVVSTNCPSGPGEILEGELARGLVECGNPETFYQTMLSMIESPPKITETHLEKFGFNYAHDKIQELLGQNVSLAYAG